MSDLIEQIAQQWDGCMYGSVGGEIDIGQAIRDAGKDLSTPPAVVPAVPSDAQILTCFADTEAEGQGAYMLAVGRAILALSQTTQPQAAKCGTCNDEGLIGGPTFSDPGEGGVPCPDCTPPAATPAAPSEAIALIREAKTILARATGANAARDAMWKRDVNDAAHRLAAALAALAQPAPVAAPAPASEAVAVPLTALHLIEDAAQAHDQCRAVVHMALSLAEVHVARAAILAGFPDAPVEIIGESSAATMEYLGDLLSNMDAVEDGDEWLDPIFEAAQARWPTAPPQAGAGKDGAQ